MNRLNYLAIALSLTMLTPANAQSLQEQNSLVDESEVSVWIQGNLKAVGGKIIFMDEYTLYLEIAPEDVLILNKNEILKIHQNGYNVTRKYLSDPELKAKWRPIKIVAGIIGVGVLAYFVFIAMLMAAYGIA